MTQSWRVYLATKGFFLFYSESDENILGTHCRNIYFLILTIIITESLNIYFSRITWFEATRSFLFGYAPNFINAPPLHCWHWVKSFQAAALFHNFQNVFRTLDREQRKLILTRLFGKHSFQFSVRNWNYE